MAERYAVATGNWSNTATWNGGTLPTSSDDVYANGFTVTIDQDVTVLSLRTTAGSTAVAGGGFVGDSTGHDVTATLRAGTTPCFSPGNSGYWTVTGDAYGGDTVNARGLLATANVLLTGDSHGGTATNTNGVLLSNGRQVGDSYGGSGGFSSAGTADSAGGIQTGDSFAGPGASGTRFVNGGVQVGTANGIGSQQGTLIFNGSIFNGAVVGSSTNASGDGLFVNAGGVAILTAITDNTAPGVAISDYCTVILYNGLVIGDVDTSGATRFTVGNENHPFINEAGGSTALLNRIAGLGGISVRTTA